MHAYLRVDDSLDFVVHHEHKSATDTTKNVGECALEEGAATFLLVNFDEGIHGAVVQLLAGARVHHETTTDGIEGVGQDAGSVGGDLCDDELEDEGRILGEERALAGIVEAEVRATVDDNTLDRDAKTLVESHRTGSLGDLGQAVNQTGEFTGALVTDIGSEARTGEVKRVHDEQRAGAGKATGRHVHGEEWPEGLLRAVGREKTLNGILECEVERLRREITNDVRDVTSPEGGEALLSSHTRKAVDDTRVSRDLARHDTRVRILRLDQQLDALNRRGRRLGDGAGNTALRSANKKYLVSSLGQLCRPKEYQFALTFPTHRLKSSRIHAMRPIDFPGARDRSTHLIARPLLPSRASVLTPP